MILKSRRPAIFNEDGQTTVIILVVTALIMGLSFYFFKDEILDRKMTKNARISLKLKQLEAVMDSQHEEDIFVSQNPMSLPAEDLLDVVRNVNRIDYMAEMIEMEKLIYEEDLAFQECLHVIKHKSDYSKFEDNFINQYSKLFAEISSVRIPGKIAYILEKKLEGDFDKYVRIPYFYWMRGILKTFHSTDLNDSLVDFFNGLEVTPWDMNLNFQVGLYLAAQGDNGMQPVKHWKKSLQTVHRYQYILDHKVDMVGSYLLKSRTIKYRKKLENAETHLLDLIAHHIVSEGKADMGELAKEYSEKAVLSIENRLRDECKGKKEDEASKKKIPEELTFPICAKNSEPGTKNEYNQKKIKSLKYCKESQESRLRLARYCNTKGLVLLRFSKTSGEADTATKLLQKSLWLNAYLLGSVKPDTIGQQLHLANTVFRERERVEKEREEVGEEKKIRQKLLRLFGVAVWRQPNVYRLS